MPLDNLLLSYFYALLPNFSYMKREQDIKVFLKLLLTIPQTRAIWSFFFLLLLLLSVISHKFITKKSMTNPSMVRQLGSK